MKYSTIIDVWDYKTGKLDILVDAKYAEAFRQFLTEKGTKCSPLSEAIFQGSKLYRDKEGILQHDQQCTVHTFEAECKSEDLKNWTDEWCLAVLHRKPISN